MDLLPLNFPVFYQCAVKGKTNLHQYDAVSILLLGKLRKDCEEIVIGDSEATGYISGKKRIKNEILTQVTRISYEEAKKRIEDLGIQNHSQVADAVRKLLTIVDVSADKQQEIIQNQDDLAVIVDTFIIALKFPSKDVFPLGTEEKARITRCYTTESYAEGKKKPGISKPDKSAPGGSGKLPQKKAVAPKIYAEPSDDIEVNTLPASDEFPRLNTEREIEKPQNDKLEQEIYLQYRNTLSPILAVLEVQLGSFPVELLNGINSAFLHLSKYKIEGDSSDLRMAESHISRTTIDAFNYFCHAIMDKYDSILLNKKKTLFKRARVPDDLVCFYEASKNKLTTAMQHGRLKGVDSITAFQLYQDAFNSFCDLDRKLDLYMQSLTSG